MQDITSSFLPHVSVGVLIAYALRNGWRSNVVPFTLAIACLWEGLQLVFTDGTPWTAFPMSEVKEIISDIAYTCLGAILYLGRDAE
tara:strand:+ start:13644 stop:13901 length:258 start_codon:yes stop_codon:yes gene_type:complete